MENSISSLEHGPRRIEMASLADGMIETHDIVRCAGWHKSEGLIVRQNIINKKK